MSAISREDARRLADLAKLALPDDELDAVAKDLGAVLGYVGRLAEVDASEASLDDEARSTWRPDAVTPTDPAVRERILAAFPQRRGDLLQTPGVFEKPKG